MSQAWAGGLKASGGLWASPRLGQRKQTQLQAGRCVLPLGSGPQNHHSRLDHLPISRAFWYEASRLLELSLFQATWWPDSLKIARK